jgi:hypothetical protein
VVGRSGSTLIACERRRQKARLTQIHPKYADVILRRWHEYPAAIRSCTIGTTLGEVMARLGTRAKIDPTELEKRCMLQCLDQEIAFWFAVATRTAERRRKLRAVPASHGPRPGQGPHSRCGAPSCES